MVLVALPLGVDVTTPYFRGVRPYRMYYLIDEVRRHYKSSVKIDEKYYCTWITRWLNGEYHFQR